MSTGAVTFQKAAAALGLQPILGAELTIEGHSTDENAPLPEASGRGKKAPSLFMGEGVGRGSALTLLVADETGWENLCWLITQAQHQAPKGEGLLRFEQLEGHSAGLIALSGGREGAVAQALETEGMGAGAPGRKALCGALRRRPFSSSNCTITAVLMMISGWPPWSNWRKR